MDDDILKQLEIRSPLLEEHLKSQAQNQAMWTERAAIAVRDARNAKLRAETIESQVMLAWAQQLGAAASEWRVTAHTKADERRVEAWESYNDTQCNADIIVGVAQAFAQRKGALETLSHNMRAELGPQLRAKAFLSSQTSHNSIINREEKELTYSEKYECPACGEGQAECLTGGWVCPSGHGFGEYTLRKSSE